MGAASRQAEKDLCEQHDFLSVRTSFTSAVKDDRLIGVVVGKWVCASWECMKVAPFTMGTWRRSQQ